MSIQTGNSRSDIKSYLESQGMSVNEWAHEQGFPPAVVYALLAGRSKGMRGIAHRAAVALGLKSKPEENSKPKGLLLKSVNSLEVVGGNQLGGLSM